MLPGAKYKHFVTAVLTLAGDLLAFDQASFRSKLAAAFGVSVDEVALAVEAASVRVTMTILTPNGAASDAALNLLGDTSAFGTILGGITLEAVTGISAGVREFVAPSPPPPSPPPPSPPPSADKPPHDTARRRPPEPASPEPVSAATLPRRERRLGGDEQER